MPTYRCAIIGCGPRARWHADAHKLIARGELVACCDLDAERRARFAGDFGIKGYADLAKMLHKEKPDLVHVVTSPLLRVELLTAVSDLGTPACLVEKPIAYEVRDWKQLVALEKRSHTKFGVNAQFRYHPDLTRCRQAIDSGKLGELLFLDCSARMTICNQGVHVLDWAMSLNHDQPPVRILGLASGAQEMTGSDHPSPDTTMGQLLFANGVRALWNLGYTAPQTLDDDAIYKHCRVAAYCERGRTLYEEFNRWQIVAEDATEEGCAEGDAIRESDDQAQANLTNAMFDWLDDDAKPVGTHLKRSLSQWNAILGLYASTVYRKPIDLPFEPEDDLWDKLKTTLRQ